MDATKRRTKRSTHAAHKYETTQVKANHILEISNKKRFAISFDTVISEIQDVLWSNNQPITRSAEAVLAMRKAGKSFKFITSSSTRTEEELVALLKKIGIPEVKPTDLVHPIKTISRFLVQYRQGKTVYSLCAPEVNAIFDKTGVTVLHMGNDSNITLNNIRDIIEPKEKIDTVITDLNFNISYAQLARAQHYLRNAECKLLVTSFDNVHRINESVSTFGNGCFIDLLRHRSQAEVQLMAKPSRYVGDDIAREYHLTDRQRVLFIGGSLMEDVDFANGSGYKSCLVYTGKSKPLDVERVPEALKPDFVADGIADFVDLFKDL